MVSMSLVCINMPVLGLVWPITHTQDGACTGALLTHLFTTPHFTHKGFKLRYVLHIASSDIQHHVRVDFKVIAM